MPDATSDDTPGGIVVRAVALELVSDHLGHCVAEAMASGGADAQEKIDEVTAAIARLVRS